MHPSLTTRTGGCSAPRRAQRALSCIPLPRLLATTRRHADLFDLACPCHVRSRCCKILGVRGVCSFFSEKGESQKTPWQARELWLVGVGVIRDSEKRRRPGTRTDSAKTGWGRGRDAPGSCAFTVQITRSPASLVGSHAATMAPRDGLEFLHHVMLFLQCCGAAAPSSTDMWHV